MIKDKGIIQRQSESYRVTSLPNTVGVNPSLLNAPIYVLNSKSANKVDIIETSWEKTNEHGEKVECHFSFNRSAKLPFPTVTHAKYLDVLLAMFAMNWKENGVLSFRYSDVLKTAGVKPYSNAAKSLQQAILRYHHHYTEWKNCWNGKQASLVFTIIKASSIVDPDTKEIRVHNPRRSKKSENWHTIVFAPEVVSALKTENKRILLTRLFKDLNHEVFCVYRYYYGYPDFFIDAQGKKRPNLIWRSLDELSQGVFKWTGQKNRFIHWLKEKLDTLVKMGLIYEPIYKEKAVAVRCKNLADIEDKQKVTLVSGSDPYAPEKPKRVGATRNISSLSNEAIIEEYLTRKAANKVPSDMTVPIDMMLARPATIKAAVDLIKGHVLSEQGA